MTVMFNKLARVAMVSAWRLIRAPYQRRARRTHVTKSARDRAEAIRMLIAGTGPGLLPVIYFWAPLLSFADYGAFFIRTGRHQWS